jgi:hypothetical protein
MIVSVNALLVFCEGPHDVAFVRMVTRKLMDFKIIELPFKDLPSPFHQLFKQSVLTHAAKNLSLDMAHKFFLPESVLRKDDQLILLFNCGGKNQYEKIRTLLSDYLPIFPQAQTFAQGAKEVVSSVRYLFLYDADTEGLDGVLKNVKTEFSKIGEINFLNEDWAETSTSEFGKSAGDKAVFVWGESPDQGTLEDILIPMFAQKHTELMNKAEAAIDNMFTWDTGDTNPKIAVPAIEKKKKSILTVVGQGAKPGSSMSVIIEQSKLLKKEDLETNAISNEFVTFVKNFMDLKA